jgi:ribosome biogenesis protein Nip4
VGKTDDKRPLGRPKYRQENNIATDLTERGWESVNWINLAQYKGRWWAIVNWITYNFHKMLGIS